MKESKLISDIDKQEFNRILNIHLSDGWEIHGELRVNIIGNTVSLYKVQYSILLVRDKQ